MSSMTDEGRRWLAEPSRSEHARRVRLGYLDLVQTVYGWTEAKSPEQAHSLASYFQALDANPI